VGCASRKFKTAPIKTENVLPQPVGAFTNPLLFFLMAFHVSTWYWKGCQPLASIQSDMVLSFFNMCSMESGVEKSRL
jgi:hypothetical protein